MKPFSLKSLLPTAALLLGISSHSYADDSLKRGFYVFQNVCMDCHGMTEAHYGDMAALGVPLSSLKKWAEGRHASLEDPIASPFPTIEAAKASFGGDVPPDMSLLARQIKGGGSYIEAMLTSYKPAPEGYKLAPKAYYNEVALTHHKIFRMPSPFMKETITYPDGMVADIPQMAHDVSLFLDWAAEPQGHHRRFYGTATLLYLFVMLGLLLGLKKTIWK
ncbi:cytochrome c1 [Acetobacteraceae bacterium ESL0709]|nr:cytochrome c1 [Acetobacteraceae bacterium ESL0697]MDF7678796.1 cytochrome c1 [Acetobacteraceae bacterium ESL0709]